MLKVLSLFDGLGGARIALDNLGVECEYYASEIDKYAIAVAKHNYPDIKELGNVNDIQNVKGIDLLIGGSPCQGLSSSGSRLGLEDHRSILFYEYARIFENHRPKYFVLENVASMKKVDRDIITDILGVEPILINSSLVTCQNRSRLYWTNIQGVEQPKDRNIFINDILEENVESVRYYVTQYFNDAIYEYLSENGGQAIYSCNRIKALHGERKVKASALMTALSSVFARQSQDAVVVLKDKSDTDIDYVNKNHPLRVHMSDYNGLKSIPNDKQVFLLRCYNTLERERLQGIPEKYTTVDGISRMQRNKMIGNGFTIPVIEHILSYMER